MSPLLLEDLTHFGTSDGPNAPRVAILSASLARLLLPNESQPIGRRLRIADAGAAPTANPNQWITVVGIAADTRERGIDESPTPTLYRPFAQDLVISPTLVVRTASEPMTAERAIVEAIHQRLPTQVVEHVATIDQVRDEAFAPRRVTALLVSSFGALAFLIALVGIAGVLAFTVTLRTAEIGIRMSLGADAARVRAMVLAQGSVLLIAGVVVGIVGAFFSTRLPSTFLFGVSAHDPLTLAVVSLGLLATGLAACWIPARRAALIDPVTALRTD